MNEIEITGWHLTGTVPVALNSFDVEHSNSFSGDFDGDLNAIIEGLILPSEVHIYIPKVVYWGLEYARQGKRYPMPRKRKSQARMSRKWRGRA